MSGVEVTYSQSFNVPTLTAPNGTELLRVEYQIAYGLQGLKGTYDLYSIIGLAMTHEDLVCMLGYKVAAHREGDGWTVELLSDGIKLRGDSELSAASIMSEAVPVIIGAPTLCPAPSGGSGPAAFWTNFTLAAEDEFGGGSVGWIPDGEVITADSGLSGEAKFAEQTNGVYLDSMSDEGASITGIYISTASSGSIELFINHEEEAAIPISATLRIDAFGSFTLPLDGEDEGAVYFYAEDLDFVGIELIACSTPVAVKLNYE